MKLDSGHTDFFCVYTCSHSDTTFSGDLTIPDNEFGRLFDCVAVQDQNNSFPNMKKIEDMKHKDYLSNIKAEQAIM